MNKKFQQLKQRLDEIHDLECASALMYWDQSTYMPKNGSVSRARQTATISKIAHEKFVSKETGKLLEELKKYEKDMEYNSFESSLIRNARIDYEKAVKIPSEFVLKMSSHIAHTYDVWNSAMPENNFKIIEPLLEKLVELSREYSEFFSGYEHIADPLINSVDNGITVSELKVLFDSLKREIVPLVKKISLKKEIDDSFLFQDFNEEKQWNLSLNIAKLLGYDLNSGRLDRSCHPFTQGLSINDVRITTRLKKNDLKESLFSTIHEVGHALYEQGISKELEGTRLACGTSSGVHESQSRLWENIIGKSIEFWEFYYSKLVDFFPEQLKNIELEKFYRAINKVKPSLIRTDADELTYNLHIMIRFELELELLEGKLRVKDLPSKWNSKYKEYLGICSEDHKNGVLQDMHWYSDLIGGQFHGYTIGNILSSQYYEKALLDNSEIKDNIKKGEFKFFTHWLRKNIHCHGAKLNTNELTEKVTGTKIDIKPYIKYLKNKYYKIYNLDKNNV